MENDPKSECLLRTHTGYNVDPIRSRLRVYHDIAARMLSELLGINTFAYHQMLHYDFERKELKARIIPEKSRRKTVSNLILNC